MSQQISNIRDIGPKLIKLGYRICAIAPGGKRPIDNNWTTTAFTEEMCLNKPASFGVGIVCGVGDNPVCCLDVDSTDERVCRDFQHWLDQQDFAGFFDYKRIGQAPKFAVVYRAERAGLRKILTEDFEKDGAKIHFEILNEGQQFCAYHIHPGTKKPYVWPQGSLLDVPARDLPTITEEQMFSCKEAFIRIAKEHGYRACSGENESADDELDIKDWGPEKDYLGKLTIAQAKEYLYGSLISNVKYDSWLKAGMALHNHFRGGREALELWNEWSSTAENYKGLEDCERTWNSFKEKSDKRVTIGSIIASYRKNQKNFDKKVYVRNIADKVYLHFKDIIKKRDSQGNRWYLFNGAHWQEASFDRTAATVLPFIEQEYKSYVEATVIPEQKKARQKFYNLYLNSPSRYIKEIMSVFAWLYGSTLADASDFDKEPRYLALENGDVDLETGEFLQPSPERKILKYSPVVYDPKACASTWKKTLKDCLVHDDTVEFFQRLVGYAALGDPKEDKIVFLHGYGCNGKSTIMSALKRVFGSLAVAMYPETLVSLSEKRMASGAATPDLMLLKGARIAIAEELPEGAKIKSEALKRLAGTETLVARNLYEAPVQFRPTATIFLCTNHLPEVEDNGTGVWRRPILIETPRNFDNDPEIKKDVNLNEKLLRESPGILNWVLEGVKLYKKYGLNIPKRHIYAVNKWRGEEDFVGTWIDECLEKDDPQSKIAMPDVYANFRLWALDRGLDKRSASWLTRRLKEKRYTIARGSKNRSFIHGVKLVDDEEALVW